MNDVGGTLPRYMQVMHILRERIVAGDYAVDSLIPTEAELCEEFSVSRYTVREALRRLKEAGFVARRQGSGTLVIAQEPAGNFTHAMRSLTELFQYAVDTRFAIDVIAPVRVDAGEAALIGSAPGTEWLRVHGLRMTKANDAVICHTSVFIDMRFAWLKAEMRDCVGPLYALIERRSGTPVAEAVQTATAVPIPEPIRPLLDAPRGAYALRLVRRYLDREGGTMVVSVNHHPAERFSYTMRIRRDALEG